jgi:hypothetical protein
VDELHSLLQKYTSATPVRENNFSQWRKSQSYEDNLSGKLQTFNILFYNMEELIGDRQLRFFCKD